MTSRRLSCFLEGYEEAAGPSMTTEGQNLIDNLRSKIESANEDMDVKRTEEAMTKMDEALDLIEESEAPSAPDLRRAWTDNITGKPGEMRYRKVTVEENLDRRNYKMADNIDYLDGDLESSILYEQTEMSDRDDLVYDYGATSLINGHVRVYKGGSWNDRVYWIIPRHPPLPRGGPEFCHHRIPLRDDARGFAQGQCDGRRQVSTVHCSL